MLWAHTSSCWLSSQQFQGSPKTLVVAVYLISCIFLKPLRQFNLSPKPEAKRGRVSSCCPVAKSCPTPWDPMDCSTPGSSRSFTQPQFMSTESVMYPIISSSAALFSFCFLSFPTSRSFPMCHFFASGGQSIGASASSSVLPMSIQGWFPLGLIGLISLLSKGLSRAFSSTTIWKHQFFGFQPSLWSYDKPRQRIKKQRHHFADKDLYSQSYGLSSSHVWMWESWTRVESWTRKLDY